jgi:hypothetical protein
VIHVAHCRFCLGRRTEGAEGSKEELNNHKPKTAAQPARPRDVVSIGCENKSGWLLQLVEPYLMIPRLSVWRGAIVTRVTAKTSGTWHVLIQPGFSV